MKKTAGYVIALVFFLLLGFISIFSYYNFCNKKEKVKEESSNLFAIYYEDENGNYKENKNYKSFKMPGYVFNEEESTCFDSNENKLVANEDYKLSYENNEVILETDQNTFCYVYFDIAKDLYKSGEACKNGDKLGECLVKNRKQIQSLGDKEEGGMYRYQGTTDIVNDNYICFGTADKNECKHGENKYNYMYRIVGATKEGKIKLISHYYDYQNTLNSSWFTRSEIISDGKVKHCTRLCSGDWYDRILMTDWKISKTDFELDLGNYVGAHHYYFKINSERKFCIDGTTKICLTSSPNDIYEFENNSTKSVTGKWGLLYLHDLLYARVEKQDNSWIHAGWLYTSNSSGGWAGGGNSLESWSYQEYFYPVFYISPDEVYVSGNGTADDPIMLTAN